MDSKKSSLKGFGPAFNPKEDTGPESMSFTELNVLMQEQPTNKDLFWEKPLKILDSNI